MNLRRKQDPAAMAAPPSSKAAPTWHSGPLSAERPDALPVAQREDLDVPAFLRRRNEGPRLETR